MLQMTITDAGLDALVDAQSGATDPIRITEIAITSTAFVLAPTLVAVPNELKRLDTLSGQSVSEMVIHMSAQDVSLDSYELRGFGLFLEDGTLFAAYSQADPILLKVDIAAFLISFDVAFADAVDGAIVFGDATFLYPPATETVRGAAEIATQAEVTTATDDQRFVTPLKLGVRLAPIAQSVADESAARIAADAALQARTITGSGLVTGGGSLAANRVLNVGAASSANFLAGTAANLALTPAALGPMLKSAAQSGYITIPSGDPANTLMIAWGRFSAAIKTTTSVTFPVAFTECYSVVATGTSETNTASQDMGATVSSNSITPTGFSAFSAADSVEALSYIAIGKKNLS